VTTLPDDPAREPPLRLAANRPFFALAVAQGVSAIGDAVTVTATPLLIAQTTGSGAQIGLIGALQLTPLLVFGLLAGTLADRADRRRLMLWSNVGRAILTGLVPAAVLIGRSPVSALIAVSFPLGVLNATYLSAYRAGLTSMVRLEQLPSAASYLQAVVTLGYMVGPGVAGVLAATIGPANVFAVDAASFALSALVVAFIRTLGAPSGGGPMMDDLRAGLAFTFLNRQMRPLVALVVIEAVANAPLIPSLTIHMLKHGMTPSTIGVAVSAGAAGAVAGIVIATRLSRWRPIAVLLGSLALAGGVNLTMGALTTAPAVIVASLLSSVLNASFLCLSLMLRTSVTPADLAGRVGAAVTVLSVAALAAGTLGGGLLIDWTSGAFVIQCSGVVFILGALLFAGSAPLRAATVTAPSRAAP